MEHRSKGRALDVGASLVEKALQMPSAKRYKGVPVPPWFNERSADAFHNMEVQVDDVVLSSLPRSGAAWVHKILRSLMHIYDDDGNVIESQGDEIGIGAFRHIYLDALPSNSEEQQVFQQGNEASSSLQDNCSGLTFEHLKTQTSPRLFSTHLFGRELLPLELLGTAETEGKGRLVILLRNLNDVMCSLHHFLGEAEDSWFGNEHGKGSFNRFIADDCPNPFGSAFDWIKEADKVVSLLHDRAIKSSNRERVLVLYYEKLRANLPDQLDRINSFLDLPRLALAKRKAIAEACALSGMRNGTAGESTDNNMDEGLVGEWKKHLTQDSWSTFDSVFENKLGNVVLAGPLRFFQLKEIPGMPVHHSQWTLETDPRTWPAFKRIILHDGMLEIDRLVAKHRARRGIYIRPPSEYWGTIPSETHPVEAGRYHLFISFLCPWASSVLMARHLLGLQDVISVDIADGQSSVGWTFLDGASCSPWKGRPGPFWLHEAYQLDNSNATTRVTVPVLWDSKTNTIVCNDSWTLIKMLSTGFAGMGNASPEARSVLAVDSEGNPTITPADLELQTDEVHEDLYDALLNGVYKAGLGFFINAYVVSDAVKTARQRVYDKLSELDLRLSKQRFLLGDKLTANDCSLAMTLLRWDSSYRQAFVLQGGRGGVLVGDGYPYLKAYLRDIFPLIESVVDFRGFRQYYRIRQAIDATAALDEVGSEETSPKEVAWPPLPDLQPLIASVREAPGPRP